MQLYIEDMNLLAIDFYDTSVYNVRYQSNVRAIPDTST